MSLGCAKTSSPSLLLFYGAWHHFTVKPQKQLLGQGTDGPNGQAQERQKKRESWEALLCGCNHAPTVSAVSGSRAWPQSNLGLLLIFTTK